MTASKLAVMLPNYLDVGDGIEPREHAFAIHLHGTCISMSIE